MNELTIEQGEQLQEALKNNNNLNFNILKVIEENTELNEVLLKFITKSPEHRPSIDKIIEEAGDVIARLVILIDQLDIEDSVQSRIDEKLSILYKHMVEKGNGTKIEVNKIIPQPYTT